MQDFCALCTPSPGPYTPHSLPSKQGPKPFKKIDDNSLIFEHKMSHFCTIYDELLHNCVLKRRLRQFILFFLWWPLTRSGGRRGLNRIPTVSISQHTGFCCCRHGYMVTWQPGVIDEHRMSSLHVILFSTNVRYGNNDTIRTVQIWESVKKFINMLGGIWNSWEIHKLKHIKCL